MNRADIEERVRQLLASLAECSPESVTMDAHVEDDLGIDSHRLLVLRESLERIFGVVISDDDVTELSRASTIIDLVAMRKSDLATPVVAPPPRTANDSGLQLPTTKLDADNVLYTDLEIGFPLMGRNNLAETPLLREIAHLRWVHMMSVSGVKSRDFADEEGERLYPTYFFTEISFPQTRPMSTYGENDRITIVGTLRRFGRFMMDGEHFLFPAHWPEERKIPPINCEAALRDEIPFIRGTSSFVRQWRGAGWLKKTRPVNPGFDRIRETAEPPDSYALVRKVKESGTFSEIPEGYVELTAGKVNVDYEIVPDRDLNGAGLLYFINYPMILDISERKVLRSAGEFALDDGLLDDRTLVNRKCGYYSNATSDEVIDVSVRAWIENPFLTGHPDPSMSPIRLLIEYQMHRKSDQRLMLVSSARKVIAGKTLGDTDLLDRLRKQKS